MLFSNMDFNLTYFLNFILLILKLRRKFWGNLGKITKWSILLPSSHFGFLKSTHFKFKFYFCSFCVQKNFWQIWVNIAKWSIRLENFHFGARFTNYGVSFCWFWIIKKTSGIFWWNSSHIGFLFLGFLLAGLIKTNSS